MTKRPATSASEPGCAKRTARRSGPSPSPPTARPGSNIARSISRTTTEPPPVPIDSRSAPVHPAGEGGADMRRFGFIAFFAAGPALAQSPQGDVLVTIYNNDLALVQDTRQIDIPAGRSRQEFADVSGQIRAETVSFAAADTAIVEQNFDYDLLSPGKLMEKAVGRTVTIVRVNPATGGELREQAKVLATNGGVVLQIGDRIEVLRDDGLPVRVIFDRVPENLRARPTLSVTLESRRAGVRPARLTYLTPGLAWKSDYVALFDENACKIDVQGWITLTNSSGTSYSKADVLMVAGAPNSGNSYNDSYRSYRPPAARDRKSTRLNSSHGYI